MSDLDLDERLAVEFHRLAGTYRRAGTEVISEAVSRRSRSRRTRRRFVITGGLAAALVLVGGVSLAVLRDPDDKVTVNVTDSRSAGSAWERLEPGPLEHRDGQVELAAGHLLFVWGGAPNDSANRFGDGATFDPATKQWSALPASPLAPRRDAIAAWTGTEVVVWGGDERTDGAAYNPSSRSWRLLPAAPLEGSRLVGAVWTGREMIVVTATSSAAFDPERSAWRDLGSPALELGPTTTTSVVWTGDVVVVLAGADTLQLDPSDGGWVRGPGLPLVPHATSAAWDGERVVAWSYSSTSSFGAPQSAAYDPTARTWLRLPDLPFSLMECQPTTTAVDAVLVAGYCDQAAVWDASRGQWFPLALPAVASGGPSLLRPGVAVDGMAFFWSNDSFWSLRVANAAAASGEVTGSAVTTVSGEATESPGITNAEFVALARARGYESARDPLAAYLATCLVAKGYDATYNDASGSVTFGGDPNLFNSCLEELPGSASLACPNSVHRRLFDGVVENADALPFIDDANTDFLFTGRVLNAGTGELRGRYPGFVRAEVGPGFGRAWEGENGGPASIRDVDDFAIVIHLESAAACPVDSALHVSFEGVPLFFVVDE